MSRYDEPEEVQTKEWEDALSIIDNIFKDYRKRKDETSSKAVRKMNPLALDIARWKVVWGKKPSQYRLKPFLAWSIDEMPSIPEEFESGPEQVDREPVDTQRIRSDKKLRMIRKKIVKMNRRVEEINVLLIHAAEDAKNHCGDEDGTWTGSILTEATKTELVIERNAMLDKLRKAKKKLMALKNAGVEQKKLILMSQEDLREVPKADGCGDNQHGLTLNFNLGANSEELNFKNGRRAAIKKEGRSSLWPKMANSPLKENSPRRSESLDCEKYKKKKFCKKHHRKINDSSGVKGCENELFLGRRALSENDFTRVVEISGNGAETGEREKSIGKSIRISEPRNASLERFGICKESRRSGCQKSSQQGCQTEFDAWKLPFSKKSELISSNAKNEASTCTFVSSSCSGAVSHSNTKKDKIRGTSFKMGDSPEAKRSAEPGKLSKAKKCPPSTQRETQSKTHARSKLETKELVTKVRSQNVNEAITKSES